jgi:hypothetical protein
MLTAGSQFNMLFVLKQKSTQIIEGMLEELREEYLNQVMK